MRLKDRVAIVTGSTSGIGKAIAVGYANERAAVVICGRREQLAKDIADELTGKGLKALAVRLDVTSSDSINRLVD